MTKRFSYNLYICLNHDVCHSLLFSPLGLFNFSDVDISCLQYAVSLVSQEKLPSVNPGDPPRAYIVSSKAVPKQSFQEFCFGYEETSFTLPVPLHLTPSFQAPALRSSDQETYFQLQVRELPWRTLKYYFFTVTRKPNRYEPNSGAI